MSVPDSEVNRTIERQTKIIGNVQEKRCDVEKKCDRTKILPNFESSVVVELRLLLLPLRHIIHPLDLPRLVQQRPAQLLTMLYLLILLNQIARRTTARAKTVLAAVACQVVCSADVAAVHQW